MADSRAWPEHLAGREPFACNRAFFTTFWGEILGSKLGGHGPLLPFFTEGPSFGSLPGSFQDELSLYFQFWVSEGLSFRKVVKLGIRGINMLTQAVCQRHHGYWVPSKYPAIYRTLRFFSLTKGSVKRGFLFVCLCVCLFFCFFDIELYELFIYFGYEAPVGCIVCKYFLLFHRLPFCFMVSFAVQKFVSLIRFHLFIFVFISIALGDWPKKTLVQFIHIQILYLLLMAIL